MVYYPVTKCRHQGLTPLRGEEDVPSKLLQTSVKKKKQFLRLSQDDDKSPISGPYDDLQTVKCTKGDWGVTLDRPGLVDIVTLTLFTDIELSIDIFILKRR